MLPRRSVCASAIGGPRTDAACRWSDWWKTRSICLTSSPSSRPARHVRRPACRFCSTPRQQALQTFQVAQPHRPRHRRTRGERPSRRGGGRARARHPGTAVRRPAGGRRLRSPGASAPARPRDAGQPRRDRPAPSTRAVGERCRRRRDRRDQRHHHRTGGLVRGRARGGLSQQPPRRPVVAAVVGPRLRDSPHLRDRGCGSVVAGPLGRPPIAGGSTVRSTPPTETRAPLRRRRRRPARRWASSCSPSPIGTAPFSSSAAPSRPSSASCCWRRWPFDCSPRSPAARRSRSRWRCATCPATRPAPVPRSARSPSPSESPRPSPSAHPPPTSQPGPATSPPPSS